MSLLCEKCSLGHEKLDVYRLAIGYVAWVFEKIRESIKNDFDPDSDPDQSYATCILNWKITIEYCIHSDQRGSLHTYLFSMRSLCL